MKAFLVSMFFVILVGMASAHPFSDVSPHHWSIQAIKELHTKYSIQLSSENWNLNNQSPTRFECAQRIEEIISSMNEIIVQKGGNIPQRDTILLERLCREFQKELINLNPKKEFLVNIFGEDHEVLNWLTKDEKTSSTKKETLSISGEYRLSYKVYFPPDPQAYKVQPHWKDELDLEINLKLGESVTGQFRFSIDDFFIHSHPNY